MSNVCARLGFERLLLATDGSESAQAAIREAIAIAKTCSSMLYVISVVEVNPEYGALAPQIVEKAEIETREHLEATRAAASKEGISCEVVAHQGEEPFRF